MPVWLIAALACTIRSHMWLLTKVFVEKLVMIHLLAPEMLGASIYMSIRNFPE